MYIPYPGVFVAGLNKHDSFISFVIPHTPGTIQEAYARPKLINYMKCIARVW